MVSAIGINFGQSCPKPDPLSIKSTTGTWKGAYTLNGEFVSFTMKIIANGDNLNAILDMPEVQVKNVSYEAKICKGQELHIKNSSISSTVEFISRPNDKGVMSGRLLFTEGGEVSEEVFTAKRTSLMAGK